MARRPLKEVIAEHGGDLTALPGVVGVGEGALDDGTPCLLVLVATDRAAAGAEVPKTIGGYPVKVDVTGAFEARPGDGA